jgi:NADH pyrophosphatase NudC (nudix superfamily)
MSAGRADRLARVRAVLEQKRQLAEWNQARCRREEAERDALSVELLQTLGDQSLMQGLFLEAKANAIRRNDAELAAARIASEKATVAAREAGATQKRIERAEARARVDEAAAKERASLLDILDDHLAAQAMRRL